VTTDLFGGEDLVGEVVGVHYTDSRTGFGVIELEPGDGGEGTRCSGPLADLVEGQTVRLVGRYTDHVKYGRTFEALLYEQVAPDTEAGLVSFLRSERFKEVPADAIQRVLTTFGAQAGTVIERQPERLSHEANLDPDVADRLHSAWQEGRSLAALVRLGQSAKLPMDVIRAAHAHFGPGARDVLADDPFALLEVERARFAHADALARSLGVPPTDERRLAAGARAAVAAARRQDGHQFLARTDATAAASQLLGVDGALAAVGIDRAVAGGMLGQERVRLSREPDRGEIDVVGTPAGLRAERDLASHLARLLRATPRYAAVDLQPDDDLLTEGQRQAVTAALTAGVSVLTGGPGTGKTRTVTEIVALADRADANIALCAPTGRAAKRLEEVVGFPATTIHRLLEARPMPDGGFVFRYGHDEQLPYDVVICDEFSMCDTALARSLVAAIEDGAHLVLVGDADQLPSVGSGDVLRDLLRSGVVPVTTLTQIHRQAAASRIVHLAREINAGDVGPVKGVDGDVFLAEERSRQNIAPRVVEAVAERIPAYFDVGIDDIQVVAPIYRGPAGVDALNAALKQRLNPDTGQPALAGFQVGDRVMQTRNDADLDVANGDSGTVVDVSKRKLRVAFPRGEVTYDREQAQNLTIAWAVTVHKSQGGEWPVLVLVCDHSHKAMLWRNLVYTAVTRASRALIVVGQLDALRYAATHDRPSNRQTGLAWRLAQEIAP
jgi:exodeoxyribonuclease V alpha subunit